ncbi:hypothetical protein LJC58_06010 [Lachnospiraceae bacterium OttesenSCG-928-D06]|nr:hypothetical protein [Lachnospiraceae bacterium OttesenSCG-928-D06]
MNTAKTTIQGFFKIVGIIALGLSAAMLLVAAVALIGASILNLIGVANVPFNIGTIAVTGFPQFILAVIIGVGLFALSALCWKSISKLRN